MNQLNFMGGVPPIVYESTTFRFSSRYTEDSNAKSVQQVYVTFCTTIERTWLRTVAEKSTKFWFGPADCSEQTELKHVLLTDEDLRLTFVIALDGIHVQKFEDSAHVTFVFTKNVNSHRKSALEQLVRWRFTQDQDLFHSSSAPTTSEFQLSHALSGSGYSGIWLLRVLIPNCKENWHDSRNAVIKCLENFNYKRRRTLINMLQQDSTKPGHCYTITEKDFENNKTLFSKNCDSHGNLITPSDHQICSVLSSHEKVNDGSNYLQLDDDYILEFYIKNDDASATDEAEHVKRCDTCKLTVNIGQHEENEHCKFIAPVETIADGLSTNSQIKSIGSLPAFLSLHVCSDTQQLAIHAAVNLNAYTQLGPVVGRQIDSVNLVKENKNVDQRLSYLWLLQQELCLDGDVLPMFIDVYNELSSNWCRYVKIVDDLSKANTVAVELDKELYLITKQEIKCNEELTCYMPGLDCVEINTIVSTTNLMHCTLCATKKTYDSIVLYKIHIILYHLDDLKTEYSAIQSQLSVVDITDDIVPVATNTAYQAEQLEKKVQEEKPYGNIDKSKVVCDVCHKRFDTGLKLRKHIVSVHPPQSSYVTCEKCGKVLKSLALLRLHFAQVHPVTRVSCTECGASFGRKHSLLRHMKVHSKHKHCVCHLCGKTFREANNLKVHMKSHGVCAYTCLVPGCSCAYDTYKKLRAHYTTDHGFSDEQIPQSRHTGGYIY